MSTFIIADGEPANPPASMPYLEKDWLIIRGVTKSMFDFSNPATIAVSGNLPVTGTVFNNLVDGASNGSLSGTSSKWLPPVVNGMLSTAGDPTFSTSVLPLLGPEFVMPAECARYLKIFWLRIVKAGWGASLIYGIFGCGGSSGLGSQDVLWFTTDASGIISNIRYRVAKTDGTFFDINLTGANLNLFANGQLHQIGLMWELANGLGQTAVYIDKVKVGAAGPSAAPGLNVPASLTASLFSGPGTTPLSNVAANIALDTRIGRVSAHNLTARPDLTMADLLQRDWDGAQGYLS
jgi:hypothetical protein